MVTFRFNERCCLKTKVESNEEEVWHQYLLQHMYHCMYIYTQRDEHIHCIPHAHTHTHTKPKCMCQVSEKFWFYFLNFHLCHKNLKIFMERFLYKACFSQSDISWHAQKVSLSIVTRPWIYGLSFHPVTHADLSLLLSHVIPWQVWQKTHTTKV